MGGLDNMDNEIISYQICWINY